VYRPIHTHSDGLVIGLLLANRAVHGGGFERSQRASLIGLPVAAVLFVVSYVCFRRIFLFSGAACFFGATAWFLLAQPRLSARFFRFRPFYVVSRLSYGMYLNHLLLLAFALNLGLHVPLGKFSSLHSLLVTCLLTGLSVTVSCVSYCLIESPFLRLRDRFLVGHTHHADGYATTNVPTYKGCKESLGQQTVRP